jgi:hypothetical protein
VLLNVKLAPDRGLGLMLLWRKLLQVIKLGFPKMLKDGCMKVAGERICRTEMQYCPVFPLPLSLPQQVAVTPAKTFEKHLSYLKVGNKSFENGAMFQIFVNDTSK